MSNNEQHIVPIELLTKFLAGEANAEEQMLVKKWKDHSDENLKEFNAIQKLWNQTETAARKETIDINAEWDRMLDAITPAKTRTLPIMRIVQIAAAIIIITGLAFLGIKQSQIQTLKSTFAKTETIELPDGTIVSLNAKSKISYPKDFGIASRELTLKGEAFFEVTKNKELPFIVNAHEAKIEVVGTRFNVRAYKKQTQIKVTVTQGTVKLSEKKQPTKKTILTAGETGTYDRQVKAIKKKPVADKNDISWKTLEMHFSNSPLTEVIAVIQNTYHMEIIISDSVKDCTITVDFQNQDLASVLKVLKSTLDLTIRKDGDKLYISGAGCR
ncbi:MAG TPA: hypothetical protein DDX98_10175 [Bacteroidales bacterium]|jgi:transmembrane sensor|nr:hypothetical protein [Bacteroidales bacterium]